MSPAAPELPDRVVMTTGETRRELSVEEFMKISLDVQVELLFRGQLAFFAGQRSIRTLDALRILRQLRARDGDRR
jgi:hypothetical protein